MPMLGLTVDPCRLIIEDFDHVIMLHTRLPALSAAEITTVYVHLYDS